MDKQTIKNRVFSSLELLDEQKTCIENVLSGDKCTLFTHHRGFRYYTVIAVASAILMLTDPGLEIVVIHSGDKYTMHEMTGILRNIFRALDEKPIRESPLDIGLKNGSGIRFISEFTRGVGGRLIFMTHIDKMSSDTIKEKVTPILIVNKTKIVMFRMSTDKPLDLVNKMMTSGWMDTHVIERPPEWTRNSGALVAALFGD